MSAGNGAAPDPIDKAIAGVTETPGVRVQFELITGRPVVLTVPRGMSDSEWLSLIANMIPLRDQLRQMAPESGIVAARTLPT